jgi:hypothetical protein
MPNAVKIRGRHDMRSIAMGLSAVVLTAASATAGQDLPTLVLSNCSATMTGSQLCVSVELATGGGAKVASAGFTLTYDATVLRLPHGGLDVIRGGALAGGQVLEAMVSEDPQTGNGQLRVTVTPPIELPIPSVRDGVLCQMCFAVKGTLPGGCAAVSLVPGSVDLGGLTGANLAALSTSASDSAPAASPAALARCRQAVSRNARLVATGQLRARRRCAGSVARCAESGTEQSSDACSEKTASICSTATARSHAEEAKHLRVVRRACAGLPQGRSVADQLRMADRELAALVDECQRSLGLSVDSIAGLFSCAVRDQAQAAEAHERGFLRRSSPRTSRSGGGR